jgi:hypothetical protein
MKQVKIAPVKLMVRHPVSKKFLRPSGRWTAKPDAALNFPNPVNAIHACIARGFNQVELILRFDGDKTDRCIPLNCF